MSSDDPLPLDSPVKIAERGEALYGQLHKERLEETSKGQFVAIDVLTGQAYVGRFPELALNAARTAAPNGVFHLIRIGAAGAFRVSFSTPAHGFWSGSLRRTR